MGKKRRKSLNLSQIDRKQAAFFGIALAFVALIVLLCITIAMRSHIQNEYASARNEIGEQLYTELHMLCQTFDQVTVPGQDVENVIIPSMADYYLCAQTLNTALTGAFGANYSVLSAQHIADLDAAFDAYDTAFRAGHSTDDAQAAMQSCIDAVRELLSARYTGGNLSAA